MDLVNQRRRTGALLYVISSALSGVAPVNRLPADSIYSLATKHSLGALASYGMELSGASPESAVSDRMQAIRRAMLFDSARAEILARFEEAGIQYICLKGVIIKDMYPAIGLREMSDNDILINYADRRRARTIMCELGYTFDSYGKGHHDAYIKEPIYNFEIHIALFSYKNETFSKYFADVMERATPVGKCERVMSEEDFYLFMKAHEYKHYASGGTGLRSLVDTYVYIKEKASALDLEFVERECEKLGISAYERDVRALSMKLFDPAFADTLLAYARDGAELPLSDEEWDMLDYISTSGTYGNASRQIDNAMKEYGEKGKGGKLRFVLDSLFPPMGYYMENAPLVYKFKILIPFYRLYRIVYVIFSNHKYVFGQLKNLIKYKKK